MKKILLTFILFFIISPALFASDEIEIITREQW
jgi:hypothetical protein